MNMSLDHEVGWANRLILGDSLLVMNSLLVKEGMAGKVIDFRANDTASRR